MVGKDLPMLRAVLAVIAAVVVYAIGSAGVDMLVMFLTMTREQIESAMRGEYPTQTLAHFVGAYSYRYVAGFIAGWLASRIVTTRSLTVPMIALALIMFLEFGGVWELKNLVPFTWIVVAYPLLAVAVLAGARVGRRRGEAEMPTPTLSQATH
jgi:hypothetical protein